jgi:ribosomal protein S18 acetylase RimI-like enzyme
MGAKEENILNERKLHFSNSWPNRFWMEYNYDSEDLKEAIRMNSIKNKSYILSLWEYDEEIFHKSIKELESNDYKVLFEQIGMYLDINRINEDEMGNLEVKFVKDKNDIDTWTEIASQSFGATIDKDIIDKIARDENIYLLLGYKNDMVVATTLLYKSDDVMGVHLVGVPSEHRGQGIAENIMKRAIAFSRDKSINTMVLQASSLGLGIYKRLGFEENFILRNYQK